MVIEEGIGGLNSIGVRYSLDLEHVGSAGSQFVFGDSKGAAVITEHLSFI